MMIMITMYQILSWQNDILSTSRIKWINELFALSCPENGDWCSRFKLHSLSLQNSLEEWQTRRDEIQLITSNKKQFQSSKCFLVKLAWPFLWNISSYTFWKHSRVTTLDVSPMHNKPYNKKTIPSPAAYCESQANPFYNWDNSSEVVCGAINAWS
jgi:hypothetical protein